VLLLLLDLLLGWVLALKPLDFSTLDLLDLVFRFVFHAALENLWLEEVVFFGEHHL